MPGLQKDLLSFSSNFCTKLQVTKLSPLNINSYSSPVTQVCTEVPKKSKEEEKRNTLIKHISSDDGTYSKCTDIVAVFY